MSKTEAMDLADFAAMLECFGASERRWPDKDRPRAKALLAENPQAAALLTQAAMMDRLLDDVAAPAMDPERVNRVVVASLAALPTPALARRRWLPRWERLIKAMVAWGDWSPIWTRAAGLAACTVAGLAVGMTVPPGGVAMNDRTVDSSAMTVSDLPSAMFAQSTLESLLQ